MAARLLRAACAARAHMSCSGWGCAMDLGGISIRAVTSFYIRRETHGTRTHMAHGAAHAHAAPARPCSRAQDMMHEARHATDDDARCTAATPPPAQTGGLCGASRGPWRQRRPPAAGRPAEEMLSFTTSSSRRHRIPRHRHPSARPRGPHAPTPLSVASRPLTGAPSLHHDPRLLHLRSLSRS